MSQIKSLDDLKALRDKYKSTVDMRSTENNENKVRVTIGMATCGIAAGARETLNAIVDEVKKQGLENVLVAQTGCMGHCYAEPVVEVKTPDKAPILYGKIDGIKGRQLVIDHIKNGRVHDEWTVEKARC